MTRVLVCGGRDYSDSGRVFQVLSHYHASNPFSILIHGQERGADTLAEAWAIQNGIPVVGYAAAWKMFGRPAGPMRNAVMLRDGRPDVLIAFPGGRGTADMCRQARAAGIPVLEIPA